MQQQPQGYPLPTINQALAQAQAQSQPAYEREREARDIREQEALEKRVSEENANRDRERDLERNQQHLRDIEHRREYEARPLPQSQQAASLQAPPNQSPSHQNHAGTIHLHQPIAIGPQSRAIHGPNGLLSNSGPATIPSGFSGALGAPTGPGNIFGGPLQQADVQRASQAGQNAQQAVLMPYGSGPAQISAAQSMSQGQQPILNVSLKLLLDFIRLLIIDRML